MDNQLSLFSSKATTRTNDPQTSKDAANALNNSGAIPEHENEILKTLREHPGSTAKGIGAIMAQDWLDKAIDINLDLDTIIMIMYIGSMPHKRLAQMGDKVRIEQSKPGNKYFVIDNS